MTYIHSSIWYKCQTLDSRNSLLGSFVVFGLDLCKISRQDKVNMLMPLQNCNSHFYMVSSSLHLMDCMFPLNKPVMYFHSNNFFQLRIWYNLTAVLIEYNIHFHTVLEIVIMVLDIYILLDMKDILQIFQEHILLLYILEGYLHLGKQNQLDIQNMLYFLGHCNIHWNISLVHWMIFHNCSLPDICNKLCYQ